MATKFVDTRFLIDSDWVGFAAQAIADHGSKYFFYIHTSSDPVEIGGGPYGRQTIYPLEILTRDEEFLVSSIKRLDSFLDLSFERTWGQSTAASRFFLDSVMDIDGNPLGVVTTNAELNQRWFEIVLDGSRLVDEAYRRYAFLHEFGHSLGLEHPFDDEDGDSVGGTNPWTSSFFPEDTVMAYRNPRSGEWPQWFSASDIRALVETWGLENDQCGSYHFSRIETGQPLMIGDPTIAQQKILSSDVVLDGFMQCQLEIYGSEYDDYIAGPIPPDGGWNHEWFYSGSGDDLILGGGGRDQLLGGLGDDTLRGGHGQDVCEGGLGDDHLYGGGGLNTLLPGEGYDSLFVLSDHVTHSELAGRNHNGSLADVLLGIESYDRITILGCTTEELDVVALEDGLGIEALGVLEAVILDSEVTHDELTTILIGDATRFF